MLENKMKSLAKRYREKIGCERIGVVCDSLFYGKTEGLMHRMKRAKYAGQSVERLKPTLGTRNLEEKVVWHKGKSTRSTPVEVSANHVFPVSDTDTIDIYEAVFFGQSRANVCNELANKSIRIITPSQYAVANDEIKSHAICARYENTARILHYTAKNKPCILFSAKLKYTPLCWEYDGKSKVIELNTN